MSTAGIVGLGYIAIIMAAGIGAFGGRDLTEQDLTAGFLIAVAGAVIGLVAMVFSFATGAYRVEGLWYVASEIVVAIIVQIGFILRRQRRLDNGSTLIFRLS